MVKKANLTIQYHTIPYHTIPYHTILNNPIIEKTGPKKIPKAVKDTEGGGFGGVFNIYFLNLPLNTLLDSCELTAIN